MLARTLQPDSLQHRGFTLLELLIVLVILGLIAGLVSPRLGGSLRSVQTKTTVNKLGSMLRYARNSAVTDQKTRVVSFNPDTNSIVLDLAKASVKDVETNEDHASEKSYERKVYQLPEGVSIEKILNGQGDLVDADKDFKILFYPADNNSGGEIIIRGESKGLYHVKVNFITGLVDASD